MKKILIATNIILFICLSITVTYIFRDRIFHDKISEEFIILSYEEFDTRTNFGFRHESFQFDYDENRIRNIIEMNEEIAVEIFKLLIVNRFPPGRFRLPHVIAYDDVHDTYVIHTHHQTSNPNRNDYYVYRFEISRKNGEIID